MNPRGDWLRAGGVGKPHGLDGSFYVTEPKPQLLDCGRQLVLRGSPMRIAARKGSDQRPIIRLEDLDDRSEVRQLRGERLLAPREEAPELGEDEWWEEDLEGCTVRGGGRAIGIVRRLVALPSCEALEVVPDDGSGEILVPLVSDAVVSVDESRREIEIDVTFLGGPRCGDSR
jgi:16S rRNA processing protein RimM